MVTYALIPASDLALASSARLTDLLAPVRVTNRFRLTGVWPDSCHRGVIPGRGEYLRWSAA